MSSASPLGRKECVVPTIQCCVRINTAIEHAFQRLGWFVADYPIPVLVANIIILIGLCFGLLRLRIETNIFDLWTPTDSPVWDEGDFIDEYWSDTNYGLVLLASYAKEGYDTNILEPQYLQEWLDVHLDLQSNLPKINYTYTHDDGTEQEVTFGLFMEDFYEPESLDVLANKSGTAVPHYASEIVPLCRNFATSPLEAQFQLPCYLFSALDCFTEGGYAFPYESYLEKTFATAVIPTNPYTDKPSFQDLSTLELGAIIAPSCDLWSGTTVPSNYIFGGDVRTADSDDAQVISVSSYETVTFVDSPFGIARKIKIATGQCEYTDFYSIECESPTDDEKEEAQELIYDWLEQFIEYTEDKIKEIDEDDDKLLTLVFWTPRTSRDLLIEASNADFGLLGVAYGAMIIFASLVAFRPRDLFLSRTEASCTGVLLVLLAVMATMGTGAIFVKFSPNVIQVLPFIALGFGVDDMFVLLFSFRYRESLTVREMIGEAVRLAGSSVAMTSCSNFFAFLVGSFMVLPDVARFAQFGMIIVILNFLTVLFGFTAVLSFTAKRMAQRHNDCSFLCCFADWTKATKTSSERHNSAHAFDPFFDFMTNDWTRIFGFCGFWALAGLGIYGCSMARLGLPLADIVPTGTYASDFLSLREKFYFSYIISVYTDADGGDRKRIDWSNLFASWVNVTEDIYSISDLVYTDSGVQDFWAWDMKEYLADQYELAFEPFELDTIEEDGNYTRKSPMCESDRISKCPSLLANYSFGSDLYDCLLYNYDVLSSPDCQAYLDLLDTSDNTTATIAQQIQLIVSGEDDVAGLYTANSESTTNVFSKSDGLGLIFQSDDGSWVVLDSDYNPKYLAPSTEEGSQPPQWGWTDLTNSLVPVTTVYWNSNFTDYSRPADVFITSDVDVTTNFEFDYGFSSSDSNEGSCYLYDAFKIQMSETTNYKKVSFGSDVDGADNVTCSAYIESTAVCSSLANEESLSSTVCGEYIESQTNSDLEMSTFWTGDCSDTGFTLSAVGSETNITSSDGCACGDSTTLSDSGVEYNYLSPCAEAEGSSDFGGFGVTSSSQCGATSQELSISCAADECNTLEACLYDYSLLQQDPTSAGLCGYDDLLTALQGNLNPNTIGRCLFTYYSQLSECCQEGLVAAVVENEEYSCGELNFLQASSSVCAIRETCDNTCSSLCYDDTNGNCGAAIGRFCEDEWNDGNVTALNNCLQYFKDFNLDQSIGQCCFSNFPDWDEDCPIAQPYYWDALLKTFVYDHVCSFSEIDGAGCSGFANNSIDQMNCLIDNIGSLTEDTCCYKAVEQSTTNYYLTHDCQGDAQELLSTNIWEISDGDLEALAGLVFNTQQPSQLSETCRKSMLVCHSDGTWPVTDVNGNVTIDCPSGYSGSRTRSCYYPDDSNVPAWSEADESECQILTCGNFTDEYNQPWEETEVNKVRYYYGPSYSVPSNYRNCINDVSTLSWLYIQRLCMYDSNTDSAVWGDIEGGCRGYYTQWEETEVFADSYCDPATASLVEEYDTTEDYDFELAQYEACESLCAVGYVHCLGILWNNQTRICQVYDSCAPVKYTDGELSSMGVTKGQIKFILNPLTLDQYAATVCTSNAQNKGIRFHVWEAWSPQGIPYPECFNTSLYVYFVNPLGGTLFRDKILFNNIDYLYQDDSYRFADLQIMSSVNNILVNGIDDDEVAVDLIIAMRKRLDEWYDMGFYCIPGGLVFDLFSQYIGVEESLIINLLYVSIAVVVTGFAFLLNWWAVVIMLLCNAAMIVEVYGFVEWLGLRVNGVLVLNIVIAVGLTMEFTAHIGRAFVLTKATRLDHERGVGLPFSTDGQIRMKKMYREMFNPVTMGAITTFLGVLPISLAEFPYFRQYYFVLYVIIVLFGWLNGVIFQPIFLSLLPPEPFDEEPLADDEEPLTKTQEAEEKERQQQEQEAGATITGGDAEQDGDQKTTE